MLKNVYKLSDGHNIVSVICNQKTIEKIVRIMMGYVNLIEEDNINTVIMNICLYEDVYEVNDDLMTENIKLHCDKDGYVYKGEPIIINNISDNIVYKIKKNEVAVYGYAKDEYYIEIVRLIRMCFQLGLRFNGYRKLHISILSKNVTWGLVGDKGAGKTTLCSLIPRFYDVTGGAVLLDGIDIRDVKLKDLRRQIGIVQQDVYLFAGTILENIRYGKPEATDEEVVNAAMAANAHEFIMSLPEGYHTDIGQRGVKLSGGQKQRLSIARVFLKNPPVLIFDEATSALDNESEKIVQHSLEMLAKDRTTFVIAHRLSTIRNAQRILVLTEDGIAEEGTHKSLLAQGGIYAGLYNMQF